MNLLSWFGIALLAFVPSTADKAVRDSVDLIEVNHYHDPRGEEILDQLIFYDWCRHTRRFQVRAWRLIKSDAQVPRRDHRLGVWVVRWHDEGVLREVTATSHRETWTKHDPELVERDFLPQEQRLDLTDPHH